jgi:hypothetical protein
VSSRGLGDVYKRQVKGERLCPVLEKSDLFPKEVSFCTQ